MWLTRQLISETWRAGRPVFNFLAGFFAFVWFTSLTWPLVPIVLSMIGAFVVGKVLRDVHSQRRSGW